MIFLSPSNRNDVKKLLKETKLLMLDFDGTLVEFEKTEKKALNAFLKKNNVRANKRKKAIKFYDQINKQLWRKFEKKELTLEEVRKSRFLALKEKYALRGDPEKLDKEYLQYLIECTKTTKQTLKLLGKLKEKYKVYVITNGIHYVQLARLEKTRIMNLTDGFVTSEKIGAPKPESDMFNYILEKENMKPKQAFVVGDSYKADILGANKLGIKSCLIVKSKTKRKKFDEKEKPNMIAKSFVEWAKFIISIN